MRPRPIKEKKEEHESSRRRENEVTCCREEKAAARRRRKTDEMSNWRRLTTTATAGAPIDGHIVVNGIEYSQRPIRESYSWERGSPHTATAAISCCYSGAFKSAVVIIDVLKDQEER